MADEPPADRAFGLGGVGRYVWAVLASLAAVLLRWLMDPLLGPSAEYLTAYFSVLALAVVAGAGPALLGTLLGALGSKALFLALGHAGRDSEDDVLRLLLFVLYGGTATALVDRVRRSEARSERLKDAAQFPEENPSPVFRLDPKGRFLYANAACAKMLGGCQRGAEAPPAVRQAAQAALAGAEPVARELQLPGRDGRVFSFTFVTGPGRQHVNFYGRDLTAAEAAQRARAVSESRLRAVMDNAHAIVWLKDLDGRFLVVNRYTEAALGLSQSELLGRTVFDLFPARLAEQYAENDRKVIESGQPMEFEEAADEKGARTFASMKFPLRDPNGRVTGLGAICSDITARKRIERELQAAKLSAEQAKAQAEEASRAKDHFLAVLSHELRTPLAPVLTALSLLERDRLSAAARNYVDVARRNLELEARLIDDLLDLTRIARGKVDLDRHVIPLCHVIDRAVEVCRPDIDARRLHFSVDYGPRRGEYMVDGDGARLQQVFWNLLKNAIKFTPHGGCVGLRCVPGDGHVMVEVADSGAGIEGTDLGRIFDAFTQARQSAGRPFGGLGLGLAISRSLVEMHGGTIEAASAGTNQGATFRVRLPTVPPVRPAAPGEDPRRAAAARRKLAVLLVEDHGDTSDMMVSMLEMAGHGVTTAGDAATALALAAEQRFDLLVSDLGLPDASGVELLRRLRQRGRTFPAIALSGYGQDRDMELSREAGFYAHLVKPVDPVRLLEAMDAAAATAVHP